MNRVVARSHSETRSSNSESHALEVPSGQKITVITLSVHMSSCVRRMFFVAFPGAVCALGWLLGCIPSEDGMRVTEPGCPPERVLTALRVYCDV